MNCWRQGEKYARHTLKTFLREKIAYLQDLGLGKEDKKVIIIKDKILINDH